MLSVLTPDNIHRIKPIKYLGRGEVKAMAWLDDETLAVATTFGLWHYTRQGHEREVLRFNKNTGYVLGFSKDATRILVRGRKNTISIYNTRNGSPLTKFDVGYDFGNEIQYFFSPDCILLATKNNNHVQIFRVNTGRQVFNMAFTSVYDVSFSEDNRFFFIKDSHTVYHIDLSTITLCKQTPVREAGGLSNRRVERHFIYGNEAHAAIDKHTIQLWRGERVVSLEGHNCHVRNVAFGQDDKTLISVDTGGMAIVWDTETGKILARKEQMGTQFLTPHPSRPAVAAVNNRHEVMIWNYLSGQKWIFPHGHKSVTLIQFNPDHSTLTSISDDDQHIYIWDLKTGEIKNRFDASDRKNPLLILSPNGQFLAMSYGETFDDAGDMTIWKLTTSEQVVQREIGRPINFTPDSQWLLFHPVFLPRSKEETDWRWLAQRLNTPMLTRRLNTTFLGERDFFMINVETGEEQLFLSLSSGEDLLISPDYQWYLRWVDSEGISVFDFATHRLEHTIFPMDDRGSSVSFSPDAKYLVTFGQVRTEEMAVVEIWEVETGQRINVFNVVNGWRAMISPDNRLLVTDVRRGSGEITLWNIQTGKRWGRLEIGNILETCFEFSPNGLFFVVYSGEESNLEIWDAHTSHHLATLKTGRLKENSVVFSPDGKLLAVANNDGTIGLWGVEDDQP